MHTLVKLTDPKHRDMDQFFKEEIADKLGELKLDLGRVMVISAPESNFHYNALDGVSKVTFHLTEFMNYNIRSIDHIPFLYLVTSWWRHQMEIFSASLVDSPHKG